MKRFFLILLLLLSTLPWGGKAWADAPARLVFSGGPEGGTFNYFANGIATRLNRTLPDDFRIELKMSAGSVENIRRIDTGETDFAIAYVGDTWLARKGLLAGDPKRYTEVRALAFLYGAPAHLLVPAGSPVHSVEDLLGLRIAIGPSGSGAAAAAMRYFGSLEMDRKLHFEMIGYNFAAQALLAGDVDAMWIVAGHPNTSITQLAAKAPVRLLDLWTEEVRRKVQSNYPFYSEVVIPAGTYLGQDRDVRSFQDTAIWVARDGLSEDKVKKALEEIFSPEGLTYMSKVKRTARQMSISKGLTGILIPLHTGADAFWRSKGLEPVPAR